MLNLRASWRSLHLPEHRLDGGAAAAIAVPPVLGAQLAVHLFARRHVLRLAAPRWRRIAQGCPLLVILLRGDDQLAVSGLGRHVGLRPVAGVRRRNPERDLVLFVLVNHRNDVDLRLRQHRAELLHVVGVRGDVGDVAEFTAEWNRLQAPSAGEQEARQAEIERVHRQIERVVDAIADGTPAAMVRDRLGELEARRLALEAELSTATAPAPRLHPNLAEVYRRRVTALTEVLAAEDAAEVRELLRSLVEAVTLVLDGGRLRIEVRGELAAILRLVEGARNKKAAQRGC